MPPKSDRTVSLPPLQVRAVVNSTDAEARTAELVFTTGALVGRQDWTGERWNERLSLEPGAVRLDRLNGGAPLLDSHNAWSLASQIGIVVEGSAVVDGNEGRATVRFSERAAVEDIWRDVMAGNIRNVSVGYRVHVFEEDASDSAQIPTRTATDWEPYEISMVPIGADPGARVRAGDGAVSRDEFQPCVIRARGDEGGSAMPPTTNNPTGATPPGDGAASAPPDGGAVRQAAGQAAGQSGAAAQPGPAMADVTAAERARAADIMAAVQAVGLPTNFADGLVRGDCDIATAHERIFAELARRSELAPGPSPAAGAVPVRFGEDRVDKMRDGMAAALITRTAGAASVRSHFPGLTLEPGEFRGMTLIDMARETLAWQNVSTRGMPRMEVAELACRTPGVLMSRAANYQTLSDFAVVLENAMHKVLVGAYAMAPDTWSRFCGTASTSDFRPHNWYRMGALTSLDSVGEHGELDSKVIPDAEKDTFQTLSYGNTIGITRQVIVNDDVGAVMRFAGALGRAAKFSIEKTVYAQLNENSGLGPDFGDGNPLFHTSRSNINATGSAISMAGLDADRVVMALQLDVNAVEYIDLRPAVLLVHTGLGGTARGIIGAEFDPDTTGKLQKPNIVKDLVSDVVDSPRVLDGSSNLRRYLFADPNLAPVFLVSFLDGQREPVLDTQDGWRIDGVETRVRFDFGVDVVDYRGTVTNAGS